MRRSRSFSVDHRTRLGDFNIEVFETLANGIASFNTWAGTSGLSRAMK
jgi:hypothetical protein